MIQGRSFVAALAVVVLGFAMGGCAVDAAAPGEPGAESQELAPRCDAVRCAEPLCAEGQHLAYQGSCCPTCVGVPSRCAAVLCAAVACAEGQILVRSNGDCCGHCVRAPAIAQCESDADCPQLNCFACPCPVAECQGRRCVTRTPDESTCGGASQ